MRNLKTTGRTAFASEIVQAASSAQARATPLFQLSPGPSPRRKSVLPKPTSILAVMRVGAEGAAGTAALSFFTRGTRVFLGAGAGANAVGVAGAGDLMVLAVLFMV